MKRLLPFFVFLIAISLVSCGENAPPTVTDTADDTEASATPLELTIVNASGKTDYRIIIAEDASNRVRNAVGDLRSHFAGAFSAPIYMKEDASTEETETEILIGNTNRKESAEAVGRLEENTYSITAQGKKIVIAAPSEEGLTTK